MSGITIFVAKEGEEGKKSDIVFDSTGRGRYLDQLVFVTVDHDKGVEKHNAYASGSLIEETEEGEIGVDGEIFLAGKQLAPGQTLDVKVKDITVRLHHRAEGESV